MKSWKAVSTHCRVQVTYTLHNTSTLILHVHCNAIALVLSCDGLLPADNVNSIIHNWNCGWRGLINKIMLIIGLIDFSFIFDYESRKIWYFWKNWKMFQSPIKSLSYPWSSTFIWPHKIMVTVEVYFYETV